MHFHRHKKPLDGYGMDVLWPPDGKPDHQSNVDIVFVHGLGGRRHSTWTKNDVLWPVELLAKDFPQARIMTWGYDSRVMAFFGPVGQGSVHSHANELNNDLASERSEGHQIFRPLIFFAHSLGGLIVKNALFRSWLEVVSEGRNKDRSAAIERSTIAVIFAGTPHRGSDKARWASLATKMASVIQKDHSSRLSDALKQGSDVVEQLQDWFKKIENNFHVFSFFEEVPVAKIGPIVESESAAIHCQHEKRRMIHANHMEMVRFDHKDCNEYKKVRDAFKQIHQYEVNNIVYRDITQPPRRVSIQGGQSGAIEDQRAPSSSRQHLAAPSQQRLLEHRVSQMSLGHGHQLSVEEIVEPVSQRPYNRTPSGGGLTTNGLGQLAHQASTTTLATMTSTHSRNSDHSVRSNEGRSTFSVQSQSQVRAQYLSLLDQGRRYARRADKNFYNNLVTAKSYFQQALDLLSHPSFSNSSTTGSTLSVNSGHSHQSIASPTQAIDRAMLHYQMMNVEFNFSFHKPLASEEKLSHLSTAEQYGWDASADARRASALTPSSPPPTTTPDPNLDSPLPFFNPTSYFPPQASTASLPRPASVASKSDTTELSTNPETLIGQVQLYLAVINGRKAELHSRLAVSAEAIKRQKEDAASEIDSALAKLRQMAPAPDGGEHKWVGYSEEFARTWRDRLVPPSAPPPPPTPAVPAPSPAAVAPPVPRPTPAVPSPSQVSVGGGPNGATASAAGSTYQSSSFSSTQSHAYGHPPQGQPAPSSYYSNSNPAANSSFPNRMGTTYPPPSNHANLSSAGATYPPPFITTSIANNNPAYNTHSNVHHSGSIYSYGPSSSSSTVGAGTTAAPVELWGQTTAWATGPTARLPTYSEVGFSTSPGGHNGGGFGGYFPPSVVGRSATTSSTVSRPGAPPPAYTMEDSGPYANGNNQYQYGGGYGGR